MRILTALCLTLIFIVTGITSLPLAAQTITASPTNVTVTETYMIANKRVPLPEGSWHLIARAEQKMPARKPSENGVLKSVALAKVTGDIVQSMIMVHTNAAITKRSWGIASDCTRSDLHFAQLVSNPGSLVALCAYVAHVVHAVPPGSTEVWQRASGLLEERRWAAPRTWLVVGFRVADPLDLLDVRYYFNPDLLPLPRTSRVIRGDGGWLAAVHSLWLVPYDWVAGKPDRADRRWVANNWSTAGTASDPERARVISELIAWTEGTLPIVYGGFKDQMLAAVPDPAPWARLAGRQEVTADHQSLLPEIAVPEASNRTALWKTLSWRGLSSGLGVLVVYGFTGSIGTTSAITIAGGLVGTAGYYLHELAWDWLSIGSRPVINDMPPAGIQH